MKVKFLGAYNAESRNTRLSSFVIDDVIAVEAGSLTSELSFPEQDKIKAILLSHGHYDHIIEVPSYAFNNSCRTNKIYATKETLEILSSHLVDGIIYPKFTEETPICGETSLQLIPLEPFIPVEIEGYTILPIPVNHPIGAVGFEITSKDGKKIFYTGDTGSGLSDVWEHISPQLLIIDLTFPNKMEDTAKNSMHLCPKMLKEELLSFHKVKGYYPKVIIVHLTPKFKREIKEEINDIAEELKLSISIAGEGEEVTV